MTNLSSKRRTFTQEFKVEAVKLVIEQNYTIETAASNLGIGASTLGKWVGAYRKEQNPDYAFPGKGKVNPDDAAFKALEKELKNVKIERDILKKALGYFAKPQE